MRSVTKEHGHGIVFNQIFITGRQPTTQAGIIYDHAHQRQRTGGTEGAKGETLKQGGNLTLLGNREGGDAGRKTQGRSGVALVSDAADGGR